MSPASSTEEFSFARTLYAAGTMVTMSTLLLAAKSSTWLGGHGRGRQRIIPEPVLEARDMSKRYRRRDGSILSAVDHVSLSINAAETVALVGETGSGKSTLARLALQLIPPDHGEIRFKGKRVDQMALADHHRCGPAPLIVLLTLRQRASIAASVGVAADICGTGAA